MGQGASTSKRTSVVPEEVSHLFAVRCAKQYTAIEIWSFKELFTELAENDGQFGELSYWKETTLMEYLGIPTSLNIQPLLLRSVHFLASFPFIGSCRSKAYPLSVDNLIKIMTFYNGKARFLLAPPYDISKLIFLSFAVTEEKEISEKDIQSKEAAQQENDKVEIQVDAEAHKNWQQFEVIQSFDGINVDEYFISASDMLNLITCLLMIMDLEPHLLTTFDSTILQPSEISKFHTSAKSILRSLDNHITADTHTDLSTIRITYPQFQLAFNASFPHLLEPLGFLFDRLLFSPNLRNPESAQGSRKSSTISNLSASPTLKDDFFKIDAYSKLVNRQSLAQIASMIGRERVYGRLKRLYVGSSAGFSLRSFESKVFKWNSPTLLFVSGRRLAPGQPNGSRERAFDELIPPVHRLQQISKNAPSSSLKESLKFVVYVGVPWKASSKHCFGDSDTIILQLEPHQDIYRASSTVNNYAYFSRSQPGGIGFGSLPPHFKASNQRTPVYNMGNVSLTLDEALEFGIFRHLGAGDSFNPSIINPEEEREDRFKINELEVWGYGRDEDLEDQKKRWEWEEREAAYRQRVNVSNLDEDRALLELAGLVGNFGSGGSV